jgi:hypothetical protein
MSQSPDSKQQMALRFKSLNAAMPNFPHMCLTVRQNDQLKKHLESSKIRVKTLEKKYKESIISSKRNTFIETNY